MTRDEALAILDEHVSNPNLKKHMLAVEAAMRWYASRYDGDPEEWGIVGLLHDFDWEIHPTLDDHPLKGQPILEQRGVPPHIRRAILAHAPRTGVMPESPMEKTLLACDEISGFIVAVALMTPGRKLAEVTVESIEKKLKRKDFAAKVNRQEIDESIRLLGIPRDEHIRYVLTAMQGIHEALGL